MKNIITDLPSRSEWMNHPILLFIFLLVVSGCIDPYSINLQSGGGTLVVDGLITNQPGPYFVKLSRSISYASDNVQRVYTDPEIKAKVVLFDNQGNSELLNETKPGIYTTTTTQGVIGRSYRLEIVTANGKKYRSHEEVLLPTPQIEKLDFSFEIYEYLITNANGDSRPMRSESFYVYATVNDPQQSGNRYRWQVDGIFEFFSQTIVPEIKQCWAPVTRLEPTIQIASDQSFNGNQFKQFVAIVPHDRPTLFLVKVRQQSLTTKAYLFWENMRNQQVNTGSVFDAPPTTIAGNIINEDMPDEKVLGYFGASAIVTKSLLINRLVASGFSDPVRGIPMQNGDCRTHVLDATNIKPDGF